MMRAAERIGNQGAGVVGFGGTGRVPAGEGMVGESGGTGRSAGFSCVTGGKRAPGPGAASPGLVGRAGSFSGMGKKLSLPVLMPGF